MAHDPTQLFSYHPQRKPGVRVTTPASSANLGPGFDVLALALDLRNTYEVWEIGTELRVEVTGEGAAAIPTDETNLFVYAMQSYFSLAGYQPGGMLLRQNNRIPLARGLGSSAATIVAALLAARYVSGYQMDDDRLLDLAASLEGHADNVAAAMGGGFQLAVLETNGRHTVRKLAWPRKLGCALFVPELLVTTESAREVLPETYGREDVVHNMSRLALFLSALTDGRSRTCGWPPRTGCTSPTGRSWCPGSTGSSPAPPPRVPWAPSSAAPAPRCSPSSTRRSRAVAGTIAAAMGRAAADVGLEGKQMTLDRSRSRAPSFKSLPEDPSGVALSR